LQKISGICDGTGLTFKIDKENGESCMSVNKVILIGNLGKDPELRYSGAQMAIATFSVATNERKKDASGQWVDHTEWHNIVVFGKTAENCANFLKKGRQAYIEGSIRSRKWQDKEGKDRYTTEILANTVQFIGAREGGSAGSAGGAGASRDNSAGSSMNEDQSSGAMGSGGSSGGVAMPNLATADALSGTGKMAANGGAAPAPAFDDDDIPF